MDTIKELREETGLSFAQIKKALDQANGDKDKAREILSEFKAVSAEKKSDRETTAGSIAVYLHSNGTVGTIVELSCETDFVAKNEEFKTLAYDIAMHITAMSPSSIDNEDGAGDETSLLAQVFIKDGSMTVREKIQGAIQKFGENVKVSRFQRYSI